MDGVQSLQELLELGSESVVGLIKQYEPSNPTNGIFELADLVSTRPKRVAAVFRQGGHVENGEIRGHGLEGDAVSESAT